MPASGLVTLGVVAETPPVSVLLVTSQVTSLFVMGGEFNRVDGEGVPTADTVATGGLGSESPLTPGLQEYAAHPTSPIKRKVVMTNIG